MENYERNWDAFSGSMRNIGGWGGGVAAGDVACWVRFPPIRTIFYCYWFLRLLPVSKFSLKLVYTMLFNNIFGHIIKLC